MAGKGFLDVKAMLKSNKKVPPKQEPKKAEEFGRNLIDQSFLEGTTEEIIFSTSFSKTNCTPKWTFNNSPIKETSKIKIISENENYSLKILKPQKKDAGKYKVEIDGVCSSASLIAEKEKTPPPVSFLKYLEGSYKGFARRNQTINCQIESGPAVVEWYKGSEKINTEDSAHYEATHDKNTGHCQLTIKNLDFKDADEYTVKVVGSTNESKTKLDIEEAPIFMKKKLGGSVLVKEGEKIHLEVELNEEDGEVDWLLNGSQITNFLKESSKFKIYKDGFKRGIVIENAPIDISNGIISCVSNKDISDCGLIVKGNTKLIKDLDPNLTLLEKEPLKLMVRADGEISEVNWFLDGVKIENSERFKINKFVSDGEFSLEINPLEMSDSNKNIYCKLDDMKSSICLIEVEKREEAPIIILESTNKTINITPSEDNSVQFELPYLIKGKRTSPLEVTLFKDGKIFICETNVEMEKVTIKIDKASRKTSGKYQVEFRNNEGADKADFEINLQDAPSPPKNFEITNVNETGCVINWKAPQDDGGSKITHYILEKYLLGKEEKKGWELVEEINGKSLSCIVEGLKPNLEYKFRVKAVNNLGPSDPAIYPSSILTKDPYGRTQTAPEFLINPTSQVEFRGQSATFTCRIRANPTALVSWFRNNIELTNPRKYSKGFQDGDYTFTIKDICGEDRGKYIFIAENKIGIAETFAMLSVQKDNNESGFYKPIKEDFKTFHRPNKKGNLNVNWSGLIIQTKDSPPTFTFPLRNRVVQNGEAKCKLLCCLSGQPPPRVTWYKDDEALNPVYYNLILADNVISIEIQNCRWDDSGIYKCVAENSFGRSSTQCYVTVE